MQVAAKSRVKETAISAMITRADGTVEDYGVISYRHRNPLLTFLWRFKRFFGRI